MQQTEDLALAAVDAATAAPDVDPDVQRLAQSLGLSTQGRPVREAIKAARASLASRADFYVEAHAVATMRAALDGDAKPAEWALERIAEGGDRIVDSAKAAPTMPSLSIGIAVGGVPQTPTRIVAAELPPLDVVARPEDDTP